MHLIVLRPYPGTPGEDDRMDWLWNTIKGSLSHERVIYLSSAGELYRQLQRDEQLKNSRILVLAAIGVTGISLELMAMLREIRLHPSCMEGSYGALIVDGAGEDSTKSIGKHVA